MHKRRTIVPSTCSIFLLLIFIWTLDINGCFIWRTFPSPSLLMQRSLLKPRKPFSRSLTCSSFLMTIHETLDQRSFFDILFMTIHLVSQPFILTLKYIEPADAFLMVKSSVWLIWSPITVNNETERTFPGFIGFSAFSL